MAFPNKSFIMDTSFIETICDYIINGCIFEEDDLLHDIQLIHKEGKTVEHTDIRNDKELITHILGVKINASILLLYHNANIVGHLTYYKWSDSISIGILCTRQEGTRATRGTQGRPGYGKILMLSFYNYCLTKFPPNTFTFDKPNKTPYIQLYSLAGARGFYKQLGFTPIKPKNQVQRIVNRLRRWSKSNVEKGEMQLKIPYASMKSKLDENNTLIVDINDDLSKYILPVDTDTEYDNWTIIYSLGSNN